MDAEHVALTGACGHAGSCPFPVRPRCGGPAGQPNGKFSDICCRFNVVLRVNVMSVILAGLEKGLSMKYFVLLAGYGEMSPWDELTPEEQDESMARLGAFDEACAAASDVAILGGEALGDGSMATTLRTRGGTMTITDGPFAEAAEQIGGYYVLDAPNLDTVIELCRVLPAYDIDIRPVLDAP
jgi:hypothetical protein